MKNINIQVNLKAWLALLSVAAGLLSSCGPITREVEEAKVENKPLTMISGVETLETAFNNKGKLVLFKYDDSLDWMSSVCREEKNSGVFESTRMTWLEQARLLAEQLGINAAEMGQKQLSEALSQKVSANAEEAQSVEKALGMVKVVKTYDTLMGIDCNLPLYRDRLYYMKTRLLSFGSEQDELYRDKQRIEVKLINAQKTIGHDLGQRLSSWQASFPSLEHFPVRLQAGLEGQREKVKAAETNYQTKLPVLSQTLVTEDAKLTAVVDESGNAVAVRYKCASSEDQRMRDALMVELEKTLGLKLVYRCAETDEYTIPYKAQSTAVKKVIKLAIDKLAKEFGPYFTAQEVLITYQVNWDRWERGERADMTISLCQVQVGESYSNYAEEKAFCDELNSLEAMLTELPNNRLTLCALVGEEEADKGYDPKGVVAKLLSEEQRGGFKSQCIERKLRKDIAGRSIELGDDWLRHYASRPENGKENLTNYFIATDGSSGFNFEQYGTTGKYTIEIYILQNLYIPETKTMGYVNMKYSTFDKGQITNVNFDGNSLKFTLNLREKVEVEVEETFTGESIEFDLDVTVIGGVRKLQGDAWFVGKDAKRVKGAVKATLDN